jgi:hypothetical protein
MDAAVPANIVELPDLPPIVVTPVSMRPRSGFSIFSLFQPLAQLLTRPLAQLVTSRLFLRSVGTINYEYLNTKISEEKDGYESMSPDVGHYSKTTSLGNDVGFHVYPTKHSPTEVVIFCHGNIRPSRYMNNIVHSDLPDLESILIKSIVIYLIKVLH